MEFIPVKDCSSTPQSVVSKTSLTSYKCIYFLIFLKSLILWEF